MKAIRLKTEHLTNPLGIDFTAPRFFWECEGGVAQTAYQIEARGGDGSLLWDSGKAAGRSSIGVAWGAAPLESRSLARWRVRLWDETDTPGPWSEEARFELGLLRPEDWNAVWINPERKHDPGERQPASYPKKTFRANGSGAARIYATAHGIYDIWLNGTHVDGYLLAPGNCQVNRRLQVQTYDVTGLVRSGENELLVSLGDGWYRGSVDFDMDVNTHGSDLALLLQMETDGKTIAATDESWQASQNGPLQLNDHMKGEVYDAEKEKIDGWHGVTVEPFGYDNLIGTDTVPVTAHETFEARRITTPAGETVLDFGQNLAGFVRFELTAKQGQKIILTHGEALDENGNFTTKNFQNPAKPFCFQKVEYTCKDGVNRYRPTKCYFGFRYVKVEGDVVPDAHSFTAAAIYSDMEQTGFFTCGNDDVNQLFHNALWSMKSNFVDVPTDCPTREKSGYSGDCQVFCHTAMYLMDCYPVLSRWIAEQAATQFEDGCVRQIAPENRKRSLWDGGAGWSDSFEIVPWKLARRYADRSVAARHYPAIRKWMMFCLNRAKKTRLENMGMPKELRPYFADQGIHWGEWLEPGMKGARQNAYMAGVFLRGVPEVATAFLSFGCHVASEMARWLGKKDDEVFFREASEQARRAYRYKYVKNGAVKKSRRQCRYVRPLAMGLLEPEERPAAAKELAEQIRRNGEKLNTGFLSTHELCRVLTDYGQQKTAYDLLLQTDRPGWLYAVRKGATTVLESWDGIDDEGRVSNSLNHYSYGAVVGWLFDRVCGIVVEDGNITIRPYPDSRLGHADAVYHSPLGTIRSGWSYENGQIHFHIVVPANAAATVVLPDGNQQEVSAGDYRFCVAAAR